MVVDRAPRMRARLLRVSRTTLYAYVSRGYVRSQATPGPSRERLYSRDDVERLRRRTEAAPRPGQGGCALAAVGRSRSSNRPSRSSTASGSTTAGTMRSMLSRSRSVAEVASLIWSGAFDGAFAPAPPRLAPAVKPDKAPALRRARAGGAGVGVGAAITPRSICAPAAWRMPAGGSPSPDSNGRLSRHVLSADRRSGARAGRGA